MRAVLILLVLCWWACGYAGSQNHDAELAATSRAALCKVVIDQVIEHASTCPEAQLALDAREECKEFGPLDLRCKEFKK